MQSIETLVEEYLEARIAVVAARRQLIDVTIRQKIRLEEAIGSQDRYRLDATALMAECLTKVERAMLDRAVDRRTTLESVLCLLPSGTRVELGGGIGLVRL